MISTVVKYVVVSEKVTNLLALPREPEVREVSVFEVGYRYPVSGYRAYPVPPLIPACPVGLPPLPPLRIVQTRSSLVFYALQLRLSLSCFDNICRLNYRRAISWI